MTTGGTADQRRDAASIEAEAAGWLARQDALGADVEEQRAFETWLHASTAHRVAWLRLRAAWAQADAAHAPGLRLVDDDDDDTAAGHVPDGWTRTRAPVRASWRLAAGLVLAGAAGVLFLPPPPGAALRYATEVGENRTLALADGSRITLNTGTRMHTTAAARRAWLDSGEAYFDIAHDPAHPFVVEAGASRITVLGTRFSVRRDGDTTRVLVVQGRVRVSGAGGAVDLLPNQSAQLDGGPVTRTQESAVATERALAWRQGRLVFDQTTLAQAAAEFNRYNRRQLVVDDPRAAAIVIGGSFAPTNLDGFVRLLEQGFALRAQHSADRIVVSR